MSGADWIDATGKSPCPICGARKWCATSADGAFVNCRHRSEGAAATKTDSSGAPYYVHALRPSGRKHRGAVADAAKPDAARCSAEFGDKVYVALLAELQLSDDHRANLRARGLADDEIDRRGYKSFPSRRLSQIAGKLREKFGAEIQQVPGFFLKDGHRGQYLTLAASAGLAIPVRDRAGRIVAIKIRGDGSSDASGRVGRSGRYFSLSSGRHGGPGSGTHVHVPIGVPKAAPVVRLTEGEIKADIATALSSIPTISAPGCTMWGLAVSELAMMRAKTVRLAFDVDYRANVEVAKALLSVWQALVDQKYIIELERWDPLHKGIDDALAAGAAIEVLTGESLTGALREIADIHGLSLVEPRGAFKRLDAEGIGAIDLSIEEPDDENRCGIIGIIGDARHQDRCDLGSDISRARFIRALAEKSGVEYAALRRVLDPEILDSALHAERAAAERPTEASSGSDDRPESQATMAFEIVREGELWHTVEPEAFATIELKGHKENWRIKDTTYKRFLAHQFYERYGTAINGESLTSAINLAEAEAIFRGIEQQAHVRIAELDGKHYLDLCNSEWQVVEISRDGWRVLDHSPIRFRRSRGMLPLPLPARGGSIQQLAELLNVGDDEFKLVVGWLVNALFARGPYPIIAFFAQQGSGKSSAAQMIRSLIDPNVAALRGPARDDRDLAIAASNSWFLASDNLSHIPQWLSDGMCRLATGGGLATRELYTNREESIFEFQRPQMITSIVEVAENSDLLDRCLVISLATIPEDRRRPEAAMHADYARVQAGILGALLDALSGALRDLPSVKLDRLPRMADFAYRATAAERALGWKPGAFMKAYEANREAANSIALEQSLVTSALLTLLDEREEWTGTASELLAAIEFIADDRTKKNKKWPADGRSLSLVLVRIAPNLDRIGWVIERDRERGKGRARRITFRKRAEISVRSVRTVRPTQAEAPGSSSSDAADTSDANLHTFTGGVPRLLESDEDVLVIDEELELAR